MDRVSQRQTTSSASTKDRYSNGGAKERGGGEHERRLTWTQVPAERHVYRWFFQRPRTRGSRSARRRRARHEPGHRPRRRRRSAPTAWPTTAHRRRADVGARQLVTRTRPRFLNDKNSITADPNDADYVYAVWDRLQRSPHGSARRRTRSGWGSRARSTSPAPPTAATPGSRRARSRSPGPTSRRSGPDRRPAREPRRLVLDFFTDFPTPPTARRTPAWLSFIRSTDRARRGASSSAST